MAALLERCGCGSTDAITDGGRESMKWRVFSFPPLLSLPPSALPPPPPYSPLPSRPPSSLAPFPPCPPPLPRPPLPQVLPIPPSLPLPATVAATNLLEQYLPGGSRAGAKPSPRREERPQEADGREVEEDGTSLAHGGGIAAVGRELYARVTYPLPSNKGQRSPRRLVALLLPGPKNTIRMGAKKAARNMGAKTAARNMGAKRGNPQAQKRQPGVYNHGSSPQCDRKGRMVKTKLGKGRAAARMCNDLKTKASGRVLTEGGNKATRMGAKRRQPGPQATRMGAQQAARPHSIDVAKQAIPAACHRAMQTRW